MLGNLVKLERVVTEMKLDGFIWDKFRNWNTILRLTKLIPQVLFLNV